MRLATLFASLLAVPVMACVSDEPAPAIESYASTTSIPIAESTETFSLDQLTMADGTRVARIVLRHDVSIEDPTGFDRALADEDQPETIPAITVGIRVEGFDAAGGVLFRSDRAVNAALGSVGWQVRAGGTLVTLDPADPADAATIAGYAAVLDEIYALRLDAPPAPPTAEPPPVTTTDALARSPDRAAGCPTPGPLGYRAAKVECFGRLLDLLVSIKDTYDKVRKAWLECDKPNNADNCAAAALDAALALARLGLRGWDFYMTCFKTSGGKGVIEIPEHKLILPGDKEFKLPPGPIRNDR